LNERNCSGFKQGFHYDEDHKNSRKGIVEKRDQGEANGTGAPSDKGMFGIHALREKSKHFKQVMELIKTGVAKDFKKALKLSKKRLGTHRRAMNKRAELEEVIRQQRKK